MKRKRFVNPNVDSKETDKNFFWETKNNNIKKFCCPCCRDLKKVLHDNFRLGVVFGFGT